MRFRKLIGNLLLICFSAFLGHNLVPHHHHTEVYNSPIASDCPFEHSDHHGHDHGDDAESGTENHPLHCHAFNDVVFQKYSAPELRPLTTDIQAMITPWQFSLTGEIHYSSPHGHAVLKLPCRIAVYPGSIGLRAPPVLG